MLVKRCLEKIKVTDVDEAREEVLSQIIVEGERERESDVSKKKL